jgi:hypothetical protein
MGAGLAVRVGPRTVERAANLRPGKNSGCESSAGQMGSPIFDWELFFAKGCVCCKKELYGNFECWM